MKITEVRTIVTCPGRSYVLVRILTDEPSLYGTGDTAIRHDGISPLCTLPHKKV